MLVRIYTAAVATIINPRALLSGVNMKVQAESFLDKKSAKKWIDMKTKLLDESLFNSTITSETFDADDFDEFEARYNVTIRRTRIDYITVPVCGAIDKERAETMAEVDNEHGDYVDNWISADECSEPEVEYAITETVELDGEE